MRLSPLDLDNMLSFAVPRRLPECDADTLQCVREVLLEEMRRQAERSSEWHGRICREIDRDLADARFPAPAQEPTG